jgi:hypothetical protein
MALIQKSDYQVGKCCNRRKLPTLVLKLDFAKAFDSVDWDCLTDVMVKRGFPQLGANQPVRLAYQPPASSTFLSQQISHQQPASSTFPSEQTSTSHQPPAKRTGRMAVCRVPYSGHF